MQDWYLDIWFRETCVALFKRIQRALSIAACYRSARFGSSAWVRASQNQSRWLRDESGPLAGRGGSVKIKSQGWIIKWTLRGSFSAVSKPNFANKDMWILNTRWKALDEIYKICMVLHRADLNISSKIRRKNAKFELFAIELMKFINSIAKKIGDFWRTNWD